MHPLLTTFAFNRIYLASSSLCDADIASSCLELNSQDFVMNLMINKNGIHTKTKPNKKLQLSVRQHMSLDKLDVSRHHYMGGEGAGIVNYYYEYK